ncbi:unnamed protein product [Natator depressus]
MADVIHPDQTYTVPGRSIFDNLFLVRDLLELGRRDGLLFTLLSLDQEKAFDRVDHGYLLSTLQAFGFRPQFVSFLRVLYASAESLVRLNWTLTEPVSFGRGVRQGCPLSGQLYALAIEPFLCLLRRRLTGLVLREPELRLVLSAYANDVLLVVQDPGDLARVEACQAIYSAASSARVNWVKSSGLAVGDWRQVSSLPPALQTIQWSAGPLLYLGVYLSATHPSPPENWQNLEGGVIERIRKWTRLLRCLSLRGRALVLNQLVLSTLWYWLNTLVPAPGFLTNLRTSILEYFWSGMHWAPVGVLHLPLKEGGQGLKCLYTQVRVFRLQALQRLLYSAGSSTWSILAHAFLRRFQGSDTTGSSFIFVREVFRETSPGCRSSTRTSSGPGNCFKRPGPWRPPWEQISTRSPCYTIPNSVCRWRSPARCARGWSWRKSRASETSWTTTGETGWIP